MEEGEKMFHDLSEKFDKIKKIQNFKEWEELDKSLTDLKHAQQDFTTTENEILENISNLKNRLSQSTQKLGLCVRIRTIFSFFD